MMAEGQQCLYGETVPVSRIDASLSNAEICFSVTLIVDQPLDFSRAKDSWYALREAWPLCAARIRKSEASPSGLEYRVPSLADIQQGKSNDEISAPSDRSLCCVDLRDCELHTFWPGIELAGKGGESSISTLPSPGCLDREHLCLLNAPKTLENCLSSDKDLVSAQVTVFKDASLVTLSVCHIFGDAWGIRDLFDAWAGLARGVMPKPLSRIGHDFFENLAQDASTEGVVPVNYTPYSLSDRIRLLANFAYDYYVSRPERSIEQRYIFLPEKRMLELQEAARQDIDAALRSGIIAEADHVSRSDVVFAWIISNIAAARDHRTMLTPVTVANARGRNVTSADTSDIHPFSGAAVAVPLRGMTHGRLASMPLGLLALQQRLKLKRQISPDDFAEVLTFNLHHNSWKRANGPRNEQSSHSAFFGPPHHMFTGISDWRSMKLGEVDFSAMAAQRGFSPSARVSAMHYHQYMPRWSDRDRFFNLGEANGGTWIMGGLSTYEWNHPAGFGRCFAA